MIEAMVAVHYDVDMISEYLGEGIIDKYQFSMRDIKAWAKYVNKYGPSLGWRQACAKGLLYIYYDRMTNDADRKMLLDCVREAIKKAKYSKLNAAMNSLLKGRKTSAGKTIKKDARKIKVLDTEIDVNPAPVSRELVPKEKDIQINNDIETLLMTWRKWPRRQVLMRRFCLLVKRGLERLPL